jgi:dihydrolipoamide dehydrogenase
MSKKISVVSVLLVFLFGFFYFDLHHHLSLATIQERQSEFSDFYQMRPYLTIGIYFLIYILVTALSLPGAAVLTLLGGSLFGLATGTLIVSFASSLGATLAFLVSRFLLRDTIEKRFSSFAQTIQAGLKKNGDFYLLSLRLIPAVPFFVINLVFGLSKMNPFKFYGLSQLGMLPGTLAYVNAGTQLAQIKSAQGLLSVPVLSSLLLLGLLPLFLRIAINWWNHRKIYSRFQKPKKFDYNLVVIGAGAAGLVTSYIAAAAKAKVALIEKHKMGGDCLNTGCVPSKTLIRSAKFLADTKRCQDLGISKADIQFRFAEIMERVQRVISTIEPNDSVDRYTQLGVECLAGEAKILSPWEVEVQGRILKTKTIVVATGARPHIPPLPGLHEMSPLTSDTLWNLKELPKRFLVLGGGAIGIELAQAFSRMGSQVTLVEKADRILSKEEPEASEWLTKKLSQEGLTILTKTQIDSFIFRDNQKFLLCQSPTGALEIPFDEVLVALGRQANVHGFGLENLGVELTESKALLVNDYLQTNIPNIYGCGDVTGRFQFTHTAAQQAWFSSMNALLKPFYGFKNDESLIPWCTYTDPEVARVGLSELQAQSQQIPYQTTFYNISHLDRALADESAYGFVKILTSPNSDRLLGVTIVGPSAGESLAEFVLAMKHKLGLNAILKTIHIYPTLSEANKMAAGQWKRQGLSPRLLKISESFNNWRRS